MKRLAVYGALLAVWTCPTAALAAPRAGQAAPAFTLPAVNGGTISLVSLRGKPVYLNFFASWCVPCNEEAPAIGKLSAHYKPRGLVVLGINELESAQKAKEFLAKYHLPYTAVVDDDGTTGKDYGAVGLPVHVFIDRSGIVKTIRLGEMDPSEIRTAIDGIL